MAYKVRVTLDIDFVPNGAGGAGVGQQQSNNPGFGASQVPGTAGVSQTLEMMIAEAVPGGDSPSAANFNTAITLAATDLETMLVTAGSVPGFTAGTPLALIQAWATGNP